MRKIKFNPKILSNYFDNKVREMCHSCKRFGTKATCPPYIESIEYYMKLLPTYKKGILFIEKFKIDNIKNWKKLGKESSLKIHNEILNHRSKLISSGHYFVLGLTAGSCKICDKCSFPCRFPNKSLIPIEGTGINVISLTKKIANIDLKFPVEKYKYFYRIGMILYQ